MKNLKLNNLKTKYKSLFYYEDGKPSLRYDQFECNDGWADLIGLVCHCIKQEIENLEYYNKYTMTEKGKVSGHLLKEVPNVKFVCIKEKFGGLRFHTSGRNEFMDGVIRLAESMSYLICEQCGTTKDVSQTEGWIKTICEDCNQKFKIEKK